MSKDPAEIVKIKMVVHLAWIFYRMKYREHSPQPASKPPEAIDTKTPEEIHQPFKAFEMLDNLTSAKAGFLKLILEIITSDDP